jgi:diguanylate cyclase (GGDEF)-like protein
LICGEVERRSSRPERDDDAGASESGDKVAAARDDAAEERDRRAENRDRLANTRDAQADTRDEAAEAGDVLAWFDRRAAGIPPSDFDPALPRRKSASWDRSDAMGDRSEAAGDRRAAAGDRDASASDRAGASLDELTGAHRRGAGFVELERDVARARRTGEPLVLAFVDVNGLKDINDARGHTAGDRVLRKVVATLRTKLRSYDLIIRFGGDEFLCAIPGVNIDQAAERLRTVNPALAALPEHGSVAIGLADLQPGDSLQDLVARADTALYQQRQQYRGPADPT